MLLACDWLQSSLIQKLKWLLIYKRNIEDHKVPLYEVRAAWHISIRN